MHALVARHRRPLKSDAAEHRSAHQQCLMEDQYEAAGTVAE